MSAEHARVGAKREEAEASFSAAAMLRPRTRLRRSADRSRLGDLAPLRELPTGVILGAILGIVGVVRIAVWQSFGIFDYGKHWILIACTVGAALVGIVTFGSLVGLMLPFILKRLGFDPASASAPFVATLVDVTGLVIYFSVALIFLRGTLL